MLSQIFIVKDQINQCIKRSTLMLAAVAARWFVQGCGPFVSNLSSWLSLQGFDLNQDLISLFLDSFFFLICCYKVENVNKV